MLYLLALKSFNKKMFKNLILLFCITYHIPKVNSMNEVEIEILWDAIRDESDFINCDNFFRYYRDEDPYELLSVIKTYGQMDSSENQSKGNYIMIFKQFTKAASKGRIHICSKQAVNTVFNEIIANDKNREYITYKDMVQYYGPMISSSQLSYILKRYGKKQMPGQTNSRDHRSISNFAAWALFKKYEYGLKFSEFRRAINIGDIPKPLRDEIAIQAEVEHLFNNMNDKHSGYVSCADMNIYYEGFRNEEFENILKTYGSKYTVEDEPLVYDEYGMKIDDFQKAGSAGYISRFSAMLINDEFMKITPEKEVRKYISFEELIQCYSTRVPASQLEYIIQNFGETQDKQYRMNLDGFTRAVNCGYLPEPLCDKITAMYKLFKEILPKDEKRNYIMLDDMMKYYKTEKHLPKMRRILRKYGDNERATIAESEKNKFLDNEWNSKHYVLSFSDFRRCINFGELTVP